MKKILLTCLIVLISITLLLGCKVKKPNIGNSSSSSQNQQSSSANEFYSGDYETPKIPV